MAEVTAGAALRENIEYGRCPACGYLMLPVLEMSPCGHADDPVLAPLTDPGLVYSWTRIPRSDGFQVLAMVDFLEGGLRLTAPVLDAEGVEIGDELVATAGLETPFAFCKAT